MNRLETLEALRDGKTVSRFNGMSNLSIEVKDDKLAAVLDGIFEIEVGLLALAMITDLSEAGLVDFEIAELVGDVKKAMDEALDITEDSKNEFKNNLAKENGVNAAIEAEIAKLQEEA